VAALERWPSRQALIVDDGAAPWHEVLGQACALAGVDPPRPGGRALLPSFPVTNRPARESLAWAAWYIDFRAGLTR
jgi:hypothetical protein